MGLHTSISSFTEEESSTAALLLLQQGLALLELGSSQDCLSTVRKSARKLSASAQKNPLCDKAWYSWALSLRCIAKLSGKKGELWKAKEKIEVALRLSGSSEIHWEAGVIYQELAETSEEACDLVKAIHHFEKGASEAMPKECWCRFGKAYADLSKKLSDMRLTFKAIQCFKKGIPSIRPTARSSEFSSASFGLLHPRSPLQANGEIASGSAQAQETKILPPKFTELSGAPYNEGWIFLGRSLRDLFLMTHEETLFKQAYDCLTAAIDLKPDCLELKLERIEILIEFARLKNNSEKLKIALQQCPTVNDQNPYALSLWAEALALSGEWEGRIEPIAEAQQKICQALEMTNEEDPLILIQCGKCLYSFANYFFDVDLYYQAIEAFQSSLSMDRTLVEGWVWMGKTFTKVSEVTDEIEPHKKALHFYRKALQLAPHHSLYFEVATHLIQQGEFEQEIELLEKAIEYLDYLANNYPLVYHESAPWFFEKGLAFSILGFLKGEKVFYQNALNSFAHVLILDPHYPSIYHHIALVYSHLAEETETTDDFYRAFYYFEMAARAGKDDEILYIDWGAAWMHFAEQAADALLEKRCLQEAEQKLTIAAKLGNLDVYYLLAELYSLKENFELSIAYLRKAHRAGTLPPLEEIQDSVWIEKLKLLPSFQEFLALLQKN